MATKDPFAPTQPRGIETIEHTEDRVAETLRRHKEAEKPAAPKALPEKKDN